MHRAPRATRRSRARRARCGRGRCRAGSGAPPWRSPRRAGHDHGAGTPTGGSRAGGARLGTSSVWSSSIRGRSVTTCSSMRSGSRHAARRRMTTWMPPPRLSRFTKWTTRIGDLATARSASSLAAACERRPVPASSAPRGGRFAERPGSLRISEQFGNGGSQRGRVLGRHEHARGSELLPRPREVRRDDRSPECHRLQHDEGEGVGPARQGEDIRPGDLDGTVLDLAEPVDRTRRDRRRRAADPTPFGVQPVRRGDRCRQGEDVSALSVVGDATGDDEWASAAWLLRRRRASEQRRDVHGWSQDDDGLRIDAESRRQHRRRLRRAGGDLDGVDVETTDPVAYPGLVHLMAHQHRRHPPRRGGGSPARGDDRVAPHEIGAHPPEHPADRRRLEDTGGPSEPRIVCIHARNRLSGGVTDPSARPSSQPASGPGQRWTTTTSHPASRRARMTSPATRGAPVRLASWDTTTARRPAL